MPLIKSISGIRGTLGGVPGEALTPVDIVKFSAAFGFWITRSKKNNKVVIGRDARPSGESISRMVAATLQNLGIEVIDLGLSTTPTVECAVVPEKAGGGIVVTASHNPAQWNALKLLDHNGEFISAEAGRTILECADKQNFTFVSPEQIGCYTPVDGYIQQHIDLIKAHPWVDLEAIRNAGFSVAVDAVNSTGGIAVPQLLEALGVKTIKKIHCHPDGRFPHDPEPLPEHLHTIRDELSRGDYDLGVVVDPDVDRLALLQEDGVPFGEEYTLVAIADYILSKKKGAVVSNLSSSRALRDIALQKGCPYHAAAVGEVNVVKKMKQVKAVIGGEGNGGVILPDFHYGRDALIGIALMLTHLAMSKKKMSLLRKMYPYYYISKNKIRLTPDMNVDRILEAVQKKYRDEHVSLLDGLKIDFEERKEWVHLRTSNTEPVMRIYAESDSMAKAHSLAKNTMNMIFDMDPKKPT